MNKYNFLEMKKLADFWNINQHCLWLHENRYKPSISGDKVSFFKPLFENHQKCEVCGAYHKDGGMKEYK